MTTPRIDISILFARLFSSYHGAMNVTSTVFVLSVATSWKFLPTKTLTGVLSQSSGISCVSKCGLSLPSKKALTKSVRVDDLISENSGLNLLISSFKVIKRTAGTSVVLRPKNSRTRSFSSSSESMETKSV